MKGNFTKSIQALRVALHTRYIVISEKTVEPVSGKEHILETDALEEMKQYENASLMSKTI